MVCPIVHPTTPFGAGGWGLGKGGVSNKVYLYLFLRGYTFSIHFL